MDCRRIQGQARTVTGANSTKNLGFRPIHPRTAPAAAGRISPTASLPDRLSRQRRIDAGGDKGAIPRTEKSASVRAETRRSFHDGVMIQRLPCSPARADFTHHALLLPGLFFPPHRPHIPH
jgi:hypothetical protein